MGDGGGNIWDIGVKLLFITEEVLKVDISERQK